MINGEGREITAGGSDKDRPTYTCAQCTAEQCASCLPCFKPHAQKQCASCVTLQAFLTPKAIKVVVRVRDLKYGDDKGRIGVISKPVDVDGDCKMKYDDDGKSKPSNCGDVASMNETFNLKQHLMVWLKRSRCFQYRTAFLRRSDS